MGAKPRKPLVLCEIVKDSDSEGHRFDSCRVYQ